MKTETLGKLLNTLILFEGIAIVMFMVSIGWLK